MIRAFFWMAVFLVGFVAVGLRADYYDFEDAQGRKIRAKPVRVVGNQVEILREDGQRFTVSPSIFTQEGREYLADWQGKQLLKKDGAIQISAVSGTTRKVKDNSEVGLLVERYYGFYRIKIRNNGDVNLNDISVEYRYFVFKNEIAGQRRGSGKTLRVSGSEAIDSIPARGEIEFETKQSEMMDTKLKPGYSWIGGGKGKSSDSLTGVWVRLYKGKEFVAEYVYPTTLPKKEDW